MEAIAGANIVLVASSVPKSMLHPAFILNWACEVTKTHREVR